MTMALSGLRTALAVAIVASTAAAEPSLKTSDGHVFIRTGDVVQNATDLLSAKEAMPLFQDQAQNLRTGLAGLNESLAPRLQQVERRSTKNVADLLEELTGTNKAVVDTNKAVVASIDGFKEAFVKAEATRAEAEKKKAATSGAGTTTKTGGVAFNPFKASVGALGGDKLRVTFPKDAELIADANVKMYQCKFTYLKDKKLDEKKFALSAMTHADTERTFACEVPAWGEGGKMPEEAYFTTDLQVLENGRVMPTPSGGQVINWTPQKPDFKYVNAPSLFKGPAGKAKEFTVAMSVIYGYGEAGYKDVKFSYATSKELSKIITKVSFGGDTAVADRTIKFSITHPKGQKKEADYYVDVTITSAKYKFSNKHRLAIKFKAQNGLGPGGAEDLLSGDAVETIKKRITGDVDKEFQLCYSSKLHGWGSSQFHNRCDNKGYLMVVMRRPDNKRVFGGFYKCETWKSSGGYRRGTNKNCAALFRINPTNKDKVDWMEKNTWHNVYVEFHPSHMMTFGGGHDMYCDRNNGNCYANMDHCYDSPYNYGSSQSRSYLTGSYQWNQRNGDYEVYITHK